MPLVARVESAGTAESRVVPAKNSWPVHVYNNPEAPRVICGLTVSGPQYVGFLESKWTRVRRRPLTVPAMVCIEWCFGVLLGDTNLSKELL